MRILVAGATGVLGRATLPHLTRHEVVGLTRSREKLESLRDLGAEPVLCDVYDYETLQWVTQQVGPQIIVNFLTDISSGSAEANNRVRREGGGNLARSVNEPRRVKNGKPREHGADPGAHAEDEEHRPAGTWGPGSREVLAPTAVLRFRWRGSF
jgi:nucleoside-diphosphate-sugar epimerase